MACGCKQGGRTGAGNGNSSDSETFESMVKQKHYWVTVAVLIVSILSLIKK